MNRKSALVGCLLACAFLLAACAPVVTSGPPLTIQSDQPVVMAVGDSVQIDGGTLTFSSVLEDSRCPSQVSCAWIGRAVLQFYLDTPDGQRHGFQLSTIHSPAKTTQAVQSGHVFDLYDIEPYPETPDRKIPQRDYRATVSVSPLATADCPLRDNDPNGYLTLICRHVVESGINVEPANPTDYTIKDSQESTQNGRPVVMLFLNCCGMGDRAVIDTETGEVLSFDTGDF